MRNKLRVGRAMLSAVSETKKKWNYLMTYDLCYQGERNNRKGYRENKLRFVNDLFYADYIRPAVLRCEIKKRSQSVYLLNEISYEYFSKVAMNFLSTIEKSLMNRISTVNKQSGKRKNDRLKELRRRVKLLKDTKTLNVHFDFFKVKHELSVGKIKPKRA